MTKITATKNGISREFSKIQWDLLGNDKMGWKIAPPEITEREKQSAPEPENGEQTESKGGERSSDLVVIQAVDVIKGMESAPAIEAYTVGDDRATIKKAAAKRMKEIANG